jgi:hypothetical protein
VYAAFLQNAPVVRHTRGFTPGWYAVPRWGTPNASPTRERRTDPAEPPNTPSGAGSGRNEHWRRSPNPSRKSAKAHPPPSLLSECRTDPAEPPNTPSGAGSGRNEPWRRTTNFIAQQRESPSSPEPPQRVQDRSRGARHPLTPHHPNTGATIQKSSHATAGYSAASAPSDPHPESTTTDSEPPDAATP